MGFVTDVFHKGKEFLQGSSKDTVEGARRFGDELLKDFQREVLGKHEQSRNVTEFNNKLAEAKTLEEKKALLAKEQKILDEALRTADLGEELLGMTVQKIGGTVLEKAGVPEKLADPTFAAVATWAMFNAKAKSEGKFQGSGMTKGLDGIGSYIGGFAHALQELSLDNKESARATLADMKDNAKGDLSGKLKDALDQADKIGEYTDMANNGMDKLKPVLDKLPGKIGTAVGDTRINLNIKERMRVIAEKYDIELDMSKSNEEIARQFTDGLEKKVMREEKVERSVQPAVRKTDTQPQPVQPAPARPLDYSPPPMGNPQGEDPNKPQPTPPPVKKTEPVTPPVKKTEPVTPPVKKTEPVTPPVKKTEPVTPPVKKTEPVTPPVKKTEPEPDLAETTVRRKVVLESSTGIAGLDRALEKLKDAIDKLTRSGKDKDKDKKAAAEKATVTDAKKPPAQQPDDRAQGILGGLATLATLVSKLTGKPPLSEGEQAAHSSRTPSHHHAGKTGHTGKAHPVNELAKAMAGIRGEDGSIDGREAAAALRKFASTQQSQAPRTAKVNRLAAAMLEENAPEVARILDTKVKKPDGQEDTVAHLLESGNTKDKQIALAILSTGLGNKAALPALAERLQVGIEVPKLQLNGAALAAAGQFRKEITAQKVATDSESLTQAPEGKQSVPQGVVQTKDTSIA